MHENFVIHPKYSHLAEKLKDVLNNFSIQGEFVTQGERNVIKKVQVGEDLLNIKKFKTPNIFQSLVYRFLRKSKAKRSYEYATKLIKWEINTPYPVAFLEIFKGGMKESFYVSEQVDYDFDFRALVHKPQFSHREEILKQFAQFTFKLHEKGVNFLDHSPGNTLIVDRGRNFYNFYLIDLNRMRFEHMGFKKRMRNFRRLWLSKTMIKIIAKEYAKQYGKPFDDTHALMLKYSRQFQKKVNSKKLRRRK